MNLYLSIIATAALVVAVATMGMLVVTLVYQRRMRRALRNRIGEATQEMWSALTFYNGVIPHGVPLPAPGGYRLSAGLLSYLASHIATTKPRLVVELGSGLSTVVLAAALKRYGGQLVSIEHDNFYLETTRSMLECRGLLDCVTLVHAELEAFGGTHTWYARSALPRLRGVDLLLVDGPPGTTCKNARYPALVHFWDTLSEDAVIVLDDCERDDERSITELWRNEYPELTSEGLHFDHMPVLMRRIRR